MTTTIVILAVLAAATLIPWTTGTICSWCGRNCDRDGNPVEHAPLAATPGLCSECSKTHTHQ